MLACQCVPSAAACQQVCPADVRVARRCRFTMALLSRASSSADVSELESCSKTADETSESFPLALNGLVSVDWLRATAFALAM